MPILRSEEYLTVKQACLEFDISEPALRKTIRIETITSGMGVEASHFAGNRGISVNIQSLTEYVKRTRVNGVKPKGRPRNPNKQRPQTGRRPGQPRKEVVLNGVVA